MIPGDKSYFPGSDVLINKFDIRDADTARAVEYKFASVRELELAVTPTEGNFDFEHLQAIHEYVFQDMYEWAGQARKVDFAKRNKHTGTINRFVPAADIEAKGKAFNEFIASKNNLRDLPKVEFVRAITEVHTRLNELHPFREGNGRSTRIFLQQLAKEAGYTLDIEAIDKDRWNIASNKALPQYVPKQPNERLVPNQSEMRQIFHESIQPTREHAFLHETRKVALQVHPDLQTSYDRLDAIRSHAAKAPGDAGERLTNAERARIAGKLHTQTERDSLMVALDKLDNEHPMIGKGKGAPADQYEVVASVMADVLTAKGYSAAQVAHALEDANKKLSAMREAGIPPPRPERFDRTAAREAARPTPERQASKSQNIDITPGDR